MISNYFYTFKLKFVTKKHIYEIIKFINNEKEEYPIKNTNRYIGVFYCLILCLLLYKDLLDEKHIILHTIDKLLF